MRYGSIPGVGQRVSRLVLGSMVFSTEPKEFDNTCRLLDRFTAAGGTTVDTARIYARGSSESAFGQWLDRSGRRQDVIVLGKGAHHNSQTLERRVTPEAIHEDIDTSLREMRLETIDIYVLHKDDPDAEVGPIVEALNAEAGAGRIKVFGGSSWTPQRVAEANAYAAEHGLQPFSVSSPSEAPSGTHQKGLRALPVGVCCEDAGGAGRRDPVRPQVPDPRRDPDAPAAAVPRRHPQR